MIITSEESEISRVLHIGNYGFIVIDGIDGSGKSTLAKKISTESNYLHINLDDYLEKNRKNFVKFIRYEELNKMIKSTNNQIILDGVCALSIVNQLKIKQDFLIYIKRISAYKIWRDEKICNINEDIDIFIKNENLELRKFSEEMARIEGKPFDPNNCYISEFREEVIRYHDKFRPHERADLIFERICGHPAENAHIDREY